MRRALRASRASRTCVANSHYQRTAMPGAASLAYARGSQSSDPHAADARAADLRNSEIAPSSHHARRRDRSSIRRLAHTIAQPRPDRAATERLHRRVPARRLAALRPTPLLRGADGRSRGQCERVIGGLSRGRDARRIARFQRRAGGARRLQLHRRQCDSGRGGYSRRHMHGVVCGAMVALAARARTRLFFEPVPDRHLALAADRSRSTRRPQAWSRRMR